MTDSSSMRDDGSGQPLYFRSAGHVLLGHWHRAPVSHPGLAVVLCATIGREELSSYPSLRALAGRLAAAGLPALRFDYPACGDSGGDEDDPHLVPAWIAAIEAAVDEARRLSGARGVVLIGLRVGALLAAEAAARREDIVGLAALAPVLSGRQYVRELRLLAAAAGDAEVAATIDSAAPAQSASGAQSGTSPARAGPRDLDAGGYWLSAETCSELGRLDVLRCIRSPASQILIAERDDLPEDPRWADQLRAAGAHVQVRRVAGIAQMMQDAHLSRVPVQVLSSVTEWVGGLVDSPSAIGSDHPTGSRQAPDQEGFPISADFGRCIETIEQIDCLGVRLEAVISAPQVRGAEGAAPCAADGRGRRLPRKVVVIPNAGATRRSGPGRLQTLLARELASRGCVVMRVDLSGFGDSAPLDHPTGHPVYFPEGQIELEALCGWLRSRTGARTCVVLGLCSGAYYGLRAATSPGTINELIAVNPLTFYWHDGDEMVLPDYKVQGEVRRYLQPKGQLARLGKLLRGKVNVRKSLGLLRRHARSGLSYAGRDIGRLVGWPLRDDLARDLRSMLDRGVRVRFVIAESDPGVDMHRRQGGAWVRRCLRRGRIRLDVLENADHTFTRRESKQRLVTAVTQALQGRQAERRDTRVERRRSGPQESTRRRSRPDRSA